MSWCKAVGSDRRVNRKERAGQGDKEMEVLSKEQQVTFFAICVKMTFSAPLDRSSFVRDFHTI